jgi:hypothetical protein
LSTLSKGTYLTNKVFRTLKNDNSSPFSAISNYLYVTYTLFNIIHKSLYKTTVDDFTYQLKIKTSVTQILANDLKISKITAWMEHIWKNTCCQFLIHFDLDFTFKVLHISLRIFKCLWTTSDRQHRRHAQNYLLLFCCWLSPQHSGRRPQRPSRQTVMWPPLPIGPRLDTEHSYRPPFQSPPAALSGCRLPCAARTATVHNTVPRVYHHRQFWVWSSAFVLRCMNPPGIKTLQICYTSDIDERRV